MLTEKDFYRILDEIMGENLGHHAKEMLAKQCKNAHDAACEMVEKRAFNAAKEQIKVVSGFKATVYGKNGFVEGEKDIMMPKEKYLTYEDYKNRQKTSINLP